MARKSVKQEVSYKSVRQECLRRVSSKSVPQECPIRESSKSVLPERSAIVSSKGVLQECCLSVSSQGVPQVGSLEIVTNKYQICVSQHTCRHSGSWVSSCFFFFGGVTGSLRHCYLICLIFWHGWTFHLPMVYLANMCWCWRIDLASGWFAMAMHPILPKDPGTGNMLQLLPCSRNWDGPSNIWLVGGFFWLKI